MDFVQHFSFQNVYQFLKAIAISEFRQFVANP